MLGPGFESQLHLGASWASPRELQRCWSHAERSLLSKRNKDIGLRRLLGSITYAGSLQLTPQCCMKVMSDSRQGGGWLLHLHPGWQAMPGPADWTASGFPHSPDGLESLPASEPTAPPFVFVSHSPVLPACPHLGPCGPALPWQSPCDVTDGTSPLQSLALGGGLSSKWRRSTAKMDSVEWNVYKVREC